MSWARERGLDGGRRVAGLTKVADPDEVVPCPKTRARLARPLAIDGASLREHLIATGRLTPIVSQTADQLRSTLRAVPDRLTARELDAAEARLAALERECST